MAVVTPIPTPPTVAGVSEDVSGTSSAGSGAISGAPVVIDVRDLGVRYSLRFTKKTTLRQSLAAMFRRDNKPTEFWALQEVN